MSSPASATERVPSTGESKKAQVVHGGERGQFAHRLDAHGGRLQPERPLLAGGRGDTHRVEGGGAVEQHGHDGVGVTYRLGRIGDDLHAVPGERLRAGDRTVPGADPVPGGEQVAGHAAAHEAGAEDRDGQGVLRVGGH